MGKIKCAKISLFSSTISIYSSETLQSSLNVAFISKLKKKKKKDGKDTSTLEKINHIFKPILCKSKLFTYFWSAVYPHSSHCSWQWNISNTSLVKEVLNSNHNLTVYLSKRKNNEEGTASNQSPYYVKLFIESLIKP